MNSNIIETSGIDGFNNMRHMATYNLIPFIIGAILCIMLDKGYIQFKLFQKIMYILTGLAVIIYIFEMYIIMNRMFNQTKTHLFTVFTLFKLITSNFVTFAMLYFMIYLRNEESFNVPAWDNNTDPFTTLYFNFFYFSIVTFSTTGFGGVLPKNTLSRFITMIQMIMTFILTAYIISKIISYSDLSNTKHLNRNKHLNHNEI
jgi:hypothetical protein